MEFQIHSRKYGKHLQGLYNTHYQNVPNADLFKYFGFDFFHDGEIRTINIIEDPFGVRMVIESLGIHKITPSGTFESIGRVLFECVFTGVTKFVRESQKVGTTGPLYFVESQITTVEIPTDASSSKETNYSLLIRTEGSESVWIQIDFNWVFVSPSEPLSFSLMESHENYQIFTWAPEA